jgi:hypothetical protein
MSLFRSLAPCCPPLDCALAISEYDHGDSDHAGCSPLNAVGDGQVLLRKMLPTKFLSRKTCAVRLDPRTNNYALQQVVGQLFHASSTAHAGVVAGASLPCTAARAGRNQRREVGASWPRSGRLVKSGLRYGSTP